MGLLELRVGNPPGGNACLSLVSVVGFQFEGSVTGRSLVKRGPTECGVSQCHFENLGKEKALAHRGRRAIFVILSDVSYC